MNGLGAARNVFIKSFYDINEYDNWKLENPQYFIYNVQFIREYNYDFATIYITYRIINYNSDEQE